VSPDDVRVASIVTKRLKCAGSVCDKACPIANIDADHTDLLRTKQGVRIFSS
jgi:hypothetical protein